VRRNNAERFRVGLHDLELHAPHSASHDKQVAFPHRPELSSKVRPQVGVEKVSGEPVDGVVQRKNVHFLAVVNVRAFVDGDHVGDPDSEVRPDHLVHADLGLVACWVRHDIADGVPPKFASDQHRVGVEKVEAFQGFWVEYDDGVIPVLHVVHRQPVRDFLGLESGGAGFLVSFPFARTHGLRCLSFHGDRISKKHVHREIERRRARTRKSSELEI
jgi:hypothetical protein